MDTPLDMPLDAPLGVSSDASMNTLPVEKLCEIFSWLDVTAVVASVCVLWRDYWSPEPLIDRPVTDTDAETLFVNSRWVSRNLCARSYNETPNDPPNDTPTNNPNDTLAFYYYGGVAGNSRVLEVLLTVPYLNYRHFELLYTSACDAGHLDRVTWLTKRAAELSISSISASSNYISKGVHVAASSGNLDVVQYLCAYAGQYHDDALNGACAGGHEDIFDFAISHCINDYDFLYIAYMFACKHGHGRLIKQLRAHGLIITVRGFLTAYKHGQYTVARYHARIGFSDVTNAATRKVCKRRDFAMLRCLDRGRMLDRNFAMTYACDCGWKKCARYLCGRLVNCDNIFLTLYLDMAVAAGWNPSDWFPLGSSTRI